jgi:hypothetical protein
LVKNIGSVWVFHSNFPTVRGKIAHPSVLLLDFARRIEEKLLIRLFCCSNFSDGSRKNCSSVCFAAQFCQTDRGKIAHPSVLLLNFARRIEEKLLIRLFCCSILPDGSPKKSLSVCPLRLTDTEKRDCRLTAPLIHAIIYFFPAPAPASSSHALSAEDRIR